MLKNLVNISSVVLLLLLAVYLTRYSIGGLKPASQPSAVFFADNVTSNDLLAKYVGASKKRSDERIRIFVMPGHEPDFGGTEYRKIKERELNVILAEGLRDFLERDAAFEVVVGRDDERWHPDLEAYFSERMPEIKRWKEAQAKAMRELVEEGELELVDDPVPHQKVSEEVALRLYGINKWIGENGFDMAVHIHINDFGGRRKSRPGQFSGYTIYVPEPQYSNSGAAREIAQSIGGRLSQMIAISDAKREKEGIVEDQDLVALGRYNTADAPSILVEYGYIYEPQFQDEKVAAAVLKEYAYQTYLGIRDFFVTHKAAAKTKDSASLPYKWGREIEADGGHSIDAFALQAALWKKDMYPPAGKDLRSCPLTGIFGGCTKAALDEFQKANLIEGESGRLGDYTRAILDSTFGK